MAAREAWWEQRNHDTRPVLVTERGGRVVAWGAFTNFKDRAGYAPTAEISVYVEPSAVGSGLGSAMLDELISRAPACLIDRVIGICFEHNETSIRLARSRGFEEWGRMPEACNMNGVRRSVVILGKIIRAPHS
jgi:phosphinothricin acetyltransferase